MKILKYVLIAIVSLVVIYLGIGLIHPSVYYGHEVMVDKPLEETWGVTQDNSKLPLWILGFKSIELISGEPGAVGSQYKVLVNPGQDQPDFELTETIVSVEEFDHISLSFDSDMMEFEQTMTLAEKDGQVSIRTDSKVTGKGVMLKSMFALMEMIGGSFKEQEVWTCNKKLDKKLRLMRPYFGFVKSSGIQLVSCNLKMSAFDGYYTTFQCIQKQTVPLV